MKTYLLSILCAFYFSEQALASGCDWNIEGQMRVEKVDRISTRSFDGLSNHFIVICVTRFSGHNCMPALLSNPSTSLELLEPEQTESGRSWDSFALPEDAYQNFYMTFKFGRFQTTMYTENVYGYIDHNCSGSDDLIHSGRTRYEIKFDDPSLGTWNFSYPGMITQKNKQPLF